MTKAHVQASAVIQRLLRSSTLRYQRIPVAFRDIGGRVGNRDQLTHWLHWYPAKMFHRIPQEILRSLPLRPNSMIVDPFCGSGTVLLEGISNGHRTVGIDVSPIARLISRVKTTPLDPTLLSTEASKVIERARSFRSYGPPDERFDFWFRPDPRRALQRLRRAIEDIEGDDHREFFLVCLSSIVRRASLADPSVAPPVRLTPAKLHRANSRYRRDFTRAVNLSYVDVFELFREALRSNLLRMSDIWMLKGQPRARVLPESTHAASTGLSSASVDLVLTSPPYCGAQKYVRSLKLEMLWIGYSLSKIIEADRCTLGTERISARGLLEPFTLWSDDAQKLRDQIVHRNTLRAKMFTAYVNYLYDFAAECRRIIRPGGQVFVTLGTSQIAGIRIQMDQLFRHALQSCGLPVRATLQDRIPSRGLITERHRTAGVINDECVVWAQGD